MFPGPEQGHREEDDPPHKEQDGDHGIGDGGDAPALFDLLIPVAPTPIPIGTAPPFPPGPAGSLFPHGLYRVRQIG